MAIDGAQNCVYDVFEITDEQFRILFPAPGQDIAFAEDFAQQISAEDEEKMSGMWEKRIPKKDALGIHGTIFYELEHKREYYPTLRDEEACNPGLGGKARADGITYEELVEQGKVPEFTDDTPDVTERYNYSEALASMPILNSEPLASVSIKGHSVVVEADDGKERRHRFTFSVHQAVRMTTADCFVPTYTLSGLPGAVLEVKNSLWIDKLKDALEDMDNENAAFMNKARHFVLPLRDNFLEVVAWKIDCHPI